MALPLRATIPYLSFSAIFGTLLSMPFILRAISAKVGNRPDTGILRIPILLLNKLMNNSSTADHRKKNFLKPDELAEFLNISKPTVYRLIEKRQLPFYKIRGSLRFKTEDVVKFLEESRIEPIKLQSYERKETE